MCCAAGRGAGSCAPAVAGFAAYEYCSPVLRCWPPGGREPSGLCTSPQPAASAARRAASAIGFDELPRRMKAEPANSMAPIADMAAIRRAIRHRPARLLATPRDRFAAACRFRLEDDFARAVVPNPCSSGRRGRPLRLLDTACSSVIPTFLGSTARSCRCVLRFSRPAIHDVLRVSDHRLARADVDVVDAAGPNPSMSI
jgi:hypothetical protein